MTLTTQQKSTLKAALLADPALTQHVIDRRDDLIAAYYNELASPAFTVWRSMVPRSDLLVDGFDWTQVDNLTAGQARIWEWLFDNDERKFNPALLGTRNAVAECWKGTAAKVAVGTFVLGLCKRSATRLEKLFAVGTGSVAVPAVATVEGELSVNEVSGILNEA